MSYSVEVDLLAALPPGWNHGRLKEVADVIPSNVDKLTVEGQLPVRLCNYVDTYKNEKITATIDFMAASATQAQIDRLSLRKGDLAITKDSESPWDIAVPTYVAEDIDGLVCGYHLAKISPSAGLIEGGYLCWALRCRTVNVQFALAAQGITRFGLGSSALADGVVPLPPLDEQRAIASYLDRETARIDSLIQHKRQLLDLLDELRVTLVQEVTRGRGTATDIRSTGDPYVPVLPKDWDLVRLGRVARIGNGSTPSRQNPSYWENGTFPWLNSAVVNSPEIWTGSEQVSALALNECSLPVLQPGTVVMAMIGQGRTRGMVSILRIQATLSQNIAYIDPDPEVLDGDYLYWYLHGSYQHIRLLSDGRGGNHSAMNCDDVARLMVALPPLDQQRRIVSEIRSSTSRLADLTKHVEKELNTLAELRDATITDAVLGRIDVRDHMKN